MKFINKVMLTSLPLLPVFFSPLYANESDLTTAQVFIDKKDPESAYKVLKSSHQTDSKITQEWFLLGISAQQLGRPREAKGYFEKVVELDPDHADRAKLELARLAYILKDAGEAKTLLSDVKQKNPPKNVKKKIETFEKKINEEGVPKTWKSHASVGYMYDSNANAGPVVDSVLLFGLPFTLSADAKGNSDNAVTTSMGIRDARGLTDNLSVQSNFSFNSTNYRNLNKLDSLVFSGSVGFTKKLNNKLAASLPIVVDRVKVGHETSYYSYSYGIAPQLTYSISKRISLSLNTTRSEKKFKAQADRNTSISSISPSIVYSINKTDFARVGLTAGREKSNIDFLTNNTTVLNTSYSHVFKNKLQASVNASYIDKKHDGIEAAYTQARHDKSTRIALNLSYKLKSIGSDLSFSVSNTHNNSNLDINTYERNQASVSLSKQF